MTVPVSSIAKAVVLTELSGVADGRARQLIDDFGSPAAVHEATLEDFEDYHYIDAETFADLQSLDDDLSRVEADLRECRDRGIGLIPFFDKRYPDRLKAVSGPLLLYARGNLSLIHHQDSVGFTGTREASAQAVEWTKETAEELAEAGRVVISGGATGIDTAAHHGALAADGDTIVVLGTGIDVPYPETNESLFERIVEENGLILSQRPPDAGPSRSGFLTRNKTLTGLSHTVTVVATDGSGGTMSTYEDATDQGRLVVCPDPELQLEPTGGIEGILEENGAEAVRDAEEILSVQGESMADTSTDETTSEQEQTGQVKFDDFS